MSLMFLYGVWALSFHLSFNLYHVWASSLLARMFACHPWEAFPLLSHLPFQSLISCILKYPLKGRHLYPSQLKLSHYNKELTWKLDAWLKCICKLRSQVNKQVLILFQLLLSFLLSFLNECLNALWFNSIKDIAYPFLI